MLDQCHFPKVVVKTPFIAQNVCETVKKKCPWPGSFYLLPSWMNISSLILPIISSESAVFLRRVITLMSGNSLFCSYSELESLTDSGAEETEGVS